MEYRTVIFQESKREVIREWLIIGAIILIVISLFTIKISYLSGIGIITILSAGYSLFKVKNQTYAEMGINAYGEKKENLIIYENAIQIRDQLIHYADLKDLVIYVDEYYQMPKQFFGSYHGGNNEIRFTHNGSLFSLNYWIKSKSDFEYVEKLVARIEEKYPPPE